MHKNFRKQKPTAIDLFAGCGGLTEGLRKAGFHVLGAIENDATAVETYKLNHPQAFMWPQDIRNIKTRTISRKLLLRRGELDLIAGCPPCQGFSSMRTLNGKHKVEDERNDLVLEFVRFVKFLRPKAVMMENVPGLATDPRFAKFCEQLKKMGYIGKYYIFNVANFGVPQRRRRLIYLAGWKREISFAKPKKKIKCVRDAISSLAPAGCSGDAIHDFAESHGAKVRERIKSIPKNGGGRTHLPKKQQLECHKRFEGFKDVYGRMHWDELSPTITSGCFNPSKGRFLHPTKNRAITLREAALLQGFQKTYKFNAEHGKTAIALMIGNALPPPFVTAHAREVIKSLI